MLGLSGAQEVTITSTATSATYDLGTNDDARSAPHDWGRARSRWGI